MARRRRSYVVAKRGLPTRLNARMGLPFPPCPCVLPLLARTRTSYYSLLPVEGTFRIYMTSSEQANFVHLHVNESKNFVRILRSTPLHCKAGLITLSYTVPLSSCALLARRISSSSMILTTPTRPFISARFRGISSSTVEQKSREDFAPDIKLPLSKAYRH